MGLITFVGTLSFLFAGTWRHSSFPSTGCTSLCLEKTSPESSNNQQQALSVWNRTVAKYGLERAMEIQRENGRKGNQAHTEKYGSVFNATAQKYGLEKAQEIYSDNARNSTEKYGTIWDRMKSKHGLKKAKAMRRETAGNIMEKYGSIFNATVQKHGLEKALEIYRESGRKVMEKYGSVFNSTVAKYGAENALEIHRGSVRRSRETLLEKYTYEEIQQMRSVDTIESARKRGLRTRYPGVLYQKAYGKWRVYFSYKGKFYLVGSAYTTEYEAALAHDDYVRKNGMKRPLHFPRKGERTSYVDKEGET